jgi:hypothetical protein
MVVGFAGSQSLSSRGSTSELGAEFAITLCSMAGDLLHLTARFRLLGWAEKCRKALKGMRSRVCRRECSMKPCWCHCRRHVLPRVGELADDVREETMAQLLRQLGALSERDRALTEQLRMTPFVSTVSGRLQNPSAVYDPR